MIPGSSGSHRKFTDGFRDAFRGILLVLLEERNMRVHLSVGLGVLVLSPFLGVSRGEYALLALTCAAVIAAEMLNTAVEGICDFMERHYNRFIGRIKDIAAGAVLISAVFAAFVGIVLLWRPEALWRVAQAMLAQPLYLAGAVLYLAAALLFIVCGPRGIAAWFVKNRKR